MALPIENLRKAVTGSYSIDRELGRGGMATVYLAQDCKHDRVVALKVLHPDLAASLGAERFLREIKLVARLNHPHILPLFDSGEADSFLYYVMPYVEGESLRERLDREKQLSVHEAVHHAKSIASALDYAHRQKIVHRDIKPENVMLYEGEAMVMDFGIAKAVSSASNDTITQAGMMVGTPAYVSPEQAAGEQNLDGQSDQYSLACVLYEMLAGERPFDGATAAAVMTKRFTETAKPLRAVRGTVPDHVERAVTRALSVDTQARFATTALFAQALGSEMLATPSDTATVPQPVVSAAKSIAVLPFTNMSADPESEYFTDGMAEELINALSRIQSLRVASRTSSFVFKGKSEDIGDIGRKLKVSTVLEGSVRKIGNKLRIGAQLINVADGYQLWSGKFDRDMEDVFAIQDEISQAIFDSLRVILSDDEKKVIERDRSVNLQAYEFYLKGRQFIHLWSRSGLEYARQMFRRAIEIDPEYARAYAGLADSCSLLYMNCDAREQNLTQGNAASRRALELGPDLAEAHLSSGLAHSLSMRFKEAEREFEFAMKLDPKLYEAAYHYGRARFAQGEFAEGAKLFERASALRPEDFQAPYFLAQCFLSLGRKDEGLSMYNKALRLIDERLELNPDDARACQLGAIASANLDQREKATEYARRALMINPDDPLLLYNISCMYAKLGNPNEALDCLEKAVDKGYGQKDWVEHDTDLDSLRELPRFR
ncbi:MAG TPA: protein kinase, partial [Gemmatimonadaceae bacterium]|nr:protein kinase [Gemmatimonadaceae bacterium]